MSDYIYHNGRLVNMDELMHSATYVGDASGGTYLEHWKYIKREKKNGKWVYYYDKDQLKKDVATVKANVKNSVNKALGYDKKARYNTAVKKLDRIETGVKTGHKYLHERASRSAELAKQEYERTAAYTIEQIKSAAESGKKKIQGWINEAKEAVDQVEKDGKKKIQGWINEGKEAIDQVEKDVKKGVKNALGYDKKEQYDSAKWENDRARENYFWTTEKLSREEDARSKAQWEWLDDPMNQEKAARLNEASRSVDILSGAASRAWDEWGVTRNTVNTTYEVYRKTAAYQIERGKRAVQAILDGLSDAVEEARKKKKRNP